MKPRRIPRTTADVLKSRSSTTTRSSSGVACCDNSVESSTRQRPPGGPCDVALYDASPCRPSGVDVVDLVDRAGSGRSCSTARTPNGRARFGLGGVIVRASRLPPRSYPTPRRKFVRPTSKARPGTGCRHWPGRTRLTARGQVGPHWVIQPGIAERMFVSIARSVLHPLRTDHGVPQQSGRAWGVEASPRAHRSSRRDEAWGMSTRPVILAQHLGPDAEASPSCPVGTAPGQARLMPESTSGHAAAGARGTDAAAGFRPDGARSGTHRRHHPCVERSAQCITPYWGDGRRPGQDQFALDTFARSARDHVLDIGSYTECSRVCR